MHLPGDGTITCRHVVRIFPQFTNSAHVSEKTPVLMVHVSKYAFLTGNGVTCASRNSHCTPALDSSSVSSESAGQLSLANSAQSPPFRYSCFHSLSSFLPCLLFLYCYRRAGPRTCGRRETTRLYWSGRRWRGIKFDPGVIID